MEEEKNKFPVHYGKLLSGSMAAVKMWSGWHSQGKSEWNFRMISSHCSETPLWASQLCFIFAGVPQRENNHLLSKTPPFSKRNRRMRGTDVQLWQHVTKESSQGTAKAQICCLREHREGAIATILDNKSSMTTISDDIWSADALEMFFLPFILRGHFLQCPWPAVAV